jgi:tyrosyl-tRNA synthetase
VTVQIGGSDQYGNIVAGTDLIRRMSTDEGADERDEKSFGITAPLVTKADGTKFGKTESGAVWLTADRTSPYAYYQFWLNATDDDATNWIKVFTFLPQDEIEAILARHAENPGARELQRTLAQQATAILHGEDAMHRAEAAGKALFSGEIADLDEPTLLEVLADVPSSEHAKADLRRGRTGSTRSTCSSAPASPRPTARPASSSPTDQSRSTARRSTPTRASPATISSTARSSPCAVARKNGT